MLKFSNTNKRSLEAVREFVGKGWIDSGHLGVRGKKPCYTLSIQGAPTVLRVIESILPFCIIKREKLLAMREEIETHVSQAYKPKIRLLPADDLRAMYEEKQLSTRNIGKLLGVAAPTVSHYLRKYGVERRRSGWKLC